MWRGYRNAVSRDWKVRVMWPWKRKLKGTVDEVREQMGLPSLHRDGQAGVTVIHPHVAASSELALELLLRRAGANLFGLGDPLTTAQWCDAAAKALMSPVFSQDIVTPYGTVELRCEDMSGIAYIVEQVEDARQLRRFVRVTEINNTPEEGT